MKEEYYSRSSIMNALLYNLSEDEAKEMMTTIEVIGAADVAPVVHGTWCGSVCSSCGESTSYWYNCNYCPNCGAKMDESEDSGNE